jgi:hypothetical protein
MCIDDFKERRLDDALDFKYETLMRADEDYFLDTAEDQLGIREALIKFKKMCGQFGYDFREELDALTDGI